jgi:hypothetical protein
MGVSVDETWDQDLSSAVNHFVRGRGVDSANLIDSPVYNSYRRVWQNTSLRVLRYYPVTILQDETHDVHSWLRLACETMVLEAL